MTLPTGQSTQTLGKTAVAGVVSAELAKSKLVGFAAVGDTVRLGAAVLFTTGDTIPGLPVWWSSADPETSS